MNLATVYNQSQAVDETVNGFLINLIRIHCYRDRRAPAVYGAALQACWMGLDSCC